MDTHDGPIIMAGDFNTWNQARLNLVKEMTREMKLKEVTDFPEGRTTGNTGSAFWNDVLGVAGDLPLDRVFFSDFIPIAARVLNYDTSDHQPILVRLKLK
jgi:endonuclease/exonuclease/phosphatase (EEP) superfamily protein YafD